MAQSGTSFTKENPKRGPGRPKGRANKATRQAREAIAAFVDGQSERLDELLKKIEEDEGPKSAWDCIMDLIEYHVPKLQRVEHTGEDGGPIHVTVKDPTRP